MSTSTNEYGQYYQYDMFAANLYNFKYMLAVYQLCYILHTAPVSKLIIFDVFVFFPLKIAKSQRGKSFLSIWNLDEVVVHVDDFTIQRIYPGNAVRDHARDLVVNRAEKFGQLFHMQLRIALAAK